ncbi:hypothetical protein BC834DRAFT_967722 [Gloeopeniophorella convolvens]|nr:hypothetical protein BC834DRAFT_967722 [Gloeopeniophorella convolvens]
MSEITSDVLTSSEDEPLQSKSAGKASSKSPNAGIAAHSEESAGEEDVGGFQSGAEDSEVRSQIVSEDEVDQLEEDEHGIDHANTSVAPASSPHHRQSLVLKISKRNLTTPAAIEPSINAARTRGQKAAKVAEIERKRLETPARDSGGSKNKRKVEVKGKATKRKKLVPSDSGTTKPKPKGKARGMNARNQQKKAVAQDLADTNMDVDEVDIDHPLSGEMATMAAGEESDREVENSIRAINKIYKDVKPVKRAGSPSSSLPRASKRFALGSQQSPLSRSPSPADIPSPKPKSRGRPRKPLSEPVGDHDVRCAVYGEIDGELKWVPGVGRKPGKHVTGPPSKLETFIVTPDMHWAEFLTMLAKQAQTVPENLLVSSITWRMHGKTSNQALGLTNDAGYQAFLDSARKASSGGNGILTIMLTMARPRMPVREVFEWAIDRSNGQTRHQNENMVNVPENNTDAAIAQAETPAPDRTTQLSAIAARFKPKTDALRERWVAGTCDKHPEL